MNHLAARAGRITLRPKWLAPHVRHDDWPAIKTKGVLS
jgi:hypothetical protein